jgi:hypothetical protein
VKKIPTIFERDWAGDKSTVINKITPGCEWVFNGEGIATRKLDGTSCRVKDGKLYKRREVRGADAMPDSFELADFDEATGKSIGWVPVGDGPDDKWHRAAFIPGMADGTYELVGPKIQGNPEGFADHALVSHSDTGSFSDAPRTFEGLRDWLSGKDIEGIVFHHADGRMAKIKLRDFKLSRKA